MKRVRITVLKILMFQDLAEKYLEDGKDTETCSFYEVGDEFIYEGGAQMPKGFCPWAWIDIYRGVNALSAGATYKPWNSMDYIQVLCCTDGVRPVVFLLEALGEV